MYISQVLSENRNTTPSPQNDPASIVTFYGQSIVPLTNVYSSRFAPTGSIYSAFIALAHLIYMTKNRLMNTDTNK
jgi:hypothetical protein